MSIIFINHFNENEGFGYGAVLNAFKTSASECFESEDIHFSFPEKSHSEKQCLIFDPATSNNTEIERLSAYVKKNNIKIALCFDQPTRRAWYAPLRRNGVRAVISYWGAPISSNYSGYKLLMRRLQFSLCRNRPDLFIFESEGMRNLATQGLGAPEKQTTVIRPGADGAIFRPPQPFERSKIHGELNLPQDKKLVVFSGHNDKRKGVHIFLAMAELITKNYPEHNLEFLLLGSRDRESSFLQYLLRDTETKNIHFLGYRNDVPEILKFSWLVVIPTVEWDSATVTAAEATLSGVPLLVSRLPGLQESVRGNVGLTVEPGSSEALTRAVIDLATNKHKYNTLKNNSIKHRDSRDRESQLKKLKAIFSNF